MLGRNRARVGTVLSDLQLSEPLANLRKIKIRSRDEFIRSQLNKNQKILEVGPLHSPLAPKHQGFNVFIVDKKDKSELLDYYNLHLREDHLKKIEDVDFVWSEQDILSNIPVAHLGTFEVIILSHVIEHLPDPIGFFRSATKLLAPGGRIFLVVPDKRYTFDYLRPLTTTGAWIEAYDQKRSVHSPRTLFEFNSMSVANRQMSDWRTSVFDLANVTFNGLALQESDDLYKSEAATSVYTDCHAWIFTPSSLNLILNECHALDYFGLTVADVVQAKSEEFFVTLTNNVRRKITHHERLYLSASSLREQAVVYNHIKLPQRSLLRKIADVVSGAYRK